MLGVGLVFFFFFNDTATTEIYTLSLHDALPISMFSIGMRAFLFAIPLVFWLFGDRKSTRLNSSHHSISYAVFCLKKKNYAAKKLGIFSLSVEVGVWEEKIFFWK